MKKTIIKPSVISSLAISAVLVLFLGMFLALSLAHSNVQAATDPAVSDPKADPTKSNFQLVWCDGPDLSSQPDLLSAAQAKNGGSYTPCDFAGALQQVQHLINIAMVIGVLAAILLFSYSGYLLVSVSFTGDQGSVKKAHDIFKKVAIGFVIMLAAWFIVYQLIAWLTGSGSSPSAALLH